MKKYILTSVALFAEYGDLNSMDNPAVNTTVCTTAEEAQKKMDEELELEKNDAEKNGYEDVSTETDGKTYATYRQGEPGSGCSWNLVCWEIKEVEL